MIYLVCYNMSSLRNRLFYLLASNSKLMDHIGFQTLVWIPLGVHEPNSVMADAEDKNNICTKGHKFFF